MNLPFSRRRELLESLLSAPKDPLRLSPLLHAPTGQILKAVHKLGLEGIVGKRIDSTYEPGERSGSIPLGSSLGAFDGAEGLIRVYHVGQGWIDFFFRNTEQPQWEPLLEFIRQTAERYLPSPPATAWPDLFGDAEPQELALPEEL